MTRAVSAADAGTVRAVDAYLLYDGLLGAGIGVAAVAFAWPGTARVSPWSDVLVVPLLLLIVIALALLRGGRLCGCLVGGGARDGVIDGAGRRFIALRVTVWTVAATASAAAGPGAVGFQFGLALSGLPFVGYALWRTPWAGRHRTERGRGAPTG